MLALIVSSFITLEGLIIGLPFALLMGVLAGLLEFMPSIGHGIWLVIASLVGLFLGSTWIPIPNWAFMILILVLHTVFTQFDLNLSDSQNNWTQRALTPFGCHHWNYCRGSYRRRSRCCVSGSHNRISQDHTRVYI